MALNNDYSIIWEKFRNEGDEKALSIIYYDHFDRLYDFGLRHTSDYSLVEDCIQNIFSYFFKKRASLKPVNNVPFFLLQSFRRELYRQMNLRNKILLSEKNQENQNLFCYNLVEDHMDREELDHVSKLISESITRLGPRQQEIIFLRFQQELDYEEIAEMLNISVDSCYKSVHRSIKTIKEEVVKVLPTGGGLVLWLFLKNFKKNIKTMSRNSDNAPL